ncbi:unnamed protein product [Durusdinium trenchii]|uniref:peptidylprolyl isomerase n=1 Tax=Durusdinium trenchii TaxID=1381693 RepID=A0ABP0HZI7_9DINO
MPQEIWQKHLSAKQPVCFKAIPGLRHMAQVCQEGRQMLRFSSFGSDATFTCDGALLLSGVILDDPFAGFIGTSSASSGTPPAKRLRTEDVMKEKPMELKVKEAWKLCARLVRIKKQIAGWKQEKSTVKKDGKPEKAVTQRTLPSGLRYEVKVRYEGRLGSNGKRFDKGVIDFRLGMGEVIQGWDEGVKGMLRGEKRRLLVPAKLGYGRSGAPPAIPPNANLVFEVELLS